MTQPVDPAALYDAVQMPRLPLLTTVFATEEALTSPVAVATLRRALDRLPAEARHRTVLGTLPGARTDIGTLLERADLFGLPVHASAPVRVTPSARVAGLGADGLETQEQIQTVRVLPRDLAAGLEALRAAVTLAARDDLTPWQRLAEWLSAVSRIRDELRVPSWSPAGAPAAPGTDTTYQLGLGVVWSGIPTGVNPAVLSGGLRPITLGRTLGLLGALDGERLGPAALLATPGAASLVRLATPGGSRTGWVVADGGRLWWAEPRIDGQAALRELDPAALEADLRTPGSAVLASPARHRAPDSGARAALELIVERVAGMDVPADTRCEIQIRELRALLHPSVRPARALEEADAAEVTAPARLLPSHTWQTQVTWAEAEAAMREAAPGSTMLFVWQPPHGIGHAFALHRTGADIWWLEPGSASPAGRVRSGRPALASMHTRAVLIGPDGGVQPIPTAPGGGLASALTDAPTGRTIGYLGFEAETPFRTTIPKSVIEADGVQELASSDDLRVHIDTRGENSIIELVSPPINILDGETRHRTRDAVLAAFRRELNLLADNARKPNARPNLELFFSRDRGFSASDEVVSRYQLNGVLPPGLGAIDEPDGEDPLREIYMQYTVGVPLAAMDQFLGFAARNTWDAERVPLVTAARGFAITLARTFQLQTGTAGADHTVIRDAMELRGFLAITYTNVVALALDPVRHTQGLPEILSKNHFLAASRFSVAAMRGFLSARVRSWLETNATVIAGRFLAHAENAIPGLHALRRLLNVPSFLQMSVRLSDKSRRTPGHLLLNATSPLSANNMELDQDQLYGVRTHFPSSRAFQDGDGLVQIELRAFGRAARMGVDEIERDLLRVEEHVSESARMTAALTAPLAPPSLSFSFGRGRTELDDNGLRQADTVAQWIVRRNLYGRNVAQAAQFDVVIEAGGRKASSDAATMRAAAVTQALTTATSRWLRAAGVLGDPIALRSIVRGNGASASPDPVQRHAANQNNRRALVWLEQATDLGPWNLASTRFGTAPDDGRELPSDHTGESLLRAHPWIVDINPGREDGGENLSNCVIAAITFELAWREQGALQAATTEELLGIDLVNFHRQSLGLADDRHEAYRIPDIAAAAEALRASPVNSRVLIAVRNSANETGHVLVGIHDERGVSFVDPQTGGLGRLPADVTALALLPLTPGVPAPPRSRLLTSAELTPLTRPLPAATGIREFADGRPVTRVGADDVFEAVIGSAAQQGLHEWLRPLGDRSAASLRDRLAARLDGEPDVFDELRVPLDRFLTSEQRTTPAFDAGDPGSVALRYLADVRRETGRLPSALAVVRAALADPELRSVWTDGVLLRAAGLALGLTAIEVDGQDTTVGTPPARDQLPLYVLRDRDRYAALGRAITPGAALTEEETEKVHGMPVETQRLLQQIADRENVVLDFRPTNPESVRYLRAGAAPKPQRLKAKSIGTRDASIGASEAVRGLVGSFRPVHPSEVGAEQRKRYETISEAWEASRSGGDGVRDLGEGLVEYNGLYYLVRPGPDARVTSFVPIAADHDLFDMFDAGTGERLTGERYEDLLTTLRTLNVAVEHGTQLSWDSPDSAAVTRQYFQGEGVVRIRPWPERRDPGGRPWEGHEAPAWAAELPPANVSLVDGGGAAWRPRQTALPRQQTRSGLPEAPAPAVLPVEGRRGSVRLADDGTGSPASSRRSSVYEPQPAFGRPPVPDIRRASIADLRRASFAEPEPVLRRSSQTGWPADSRRGSAASLYPPSPGASAPGSDLTESRTASRRPSATGWVDMAAALVSRRPSVLGGIRARQPLPASPLPPIGPGEAIFNPGFTFGTATSRPEPPIAPDAPASDALTAPPRAFLRDGSAPSRRPSLAPPVQNSAAGMLELSARIRRRIATAGTDVGEVYCATAVSLARDELFGRRGVTLTPQDGRARDDLTVRGDMWAGWGTPSTWPRASDWEQIGRLVGGEIGRTAFVLAGRPGSYGHAFLVVNTADGVLWVDPSAHADADRVRSHAQMTAGAGPAGLTHATGVVDLRAWVFAANGTAVPVPEAVPMSARPAAVALALTDPPEQRFRGSGIEDEQTVMLFFDSKAGRAEDLANKTLATAADGSYRFEVETKTFYRAGGRYYATQELAEATGSAVKEEVAGMIERVSAILSAHPHEVHRAAPGPVFDAFARAAARADLIAGEQGAGPVMSLTDFLDGEGLVFERLAGRTRVGRPPIGDVPGSHYHYTHGVVLSGLREFLENVRDHTWRDEARGYLTQAHLSDGLTFGDVLAERFRAFLRAEGVAPVPDEQRAVTEVAGYAALFYDNFAGVAHQVINEHELNKVNIAVLSRAEAFADLLALLPAAAQEFFAQDMARIWDQLEQTFRTRMPDFDERYRAEYELEETADVVFDAVEPSDEYHLTLREYAESAFRSGSPRVTQRQMLHGVMNVSPDVATSGLLRPHAVVEVRAYGARRETAAQARRHNATLTALANRAYESELAVPAVQLAADSEAWLHPGPDRALRREPGLGAASSRAVALGEIAAGRGHALVLIEARAVLARPGRRTGQGGGTPSRAAAALRQILDEAPHLARDAIIAVQDLDAEINALRHEHRLTLVHAITPPAVTPSGAAGSRVWRLATAANTVIELGTGELTADLLGKALDGADEAALAISPLPAVLTVGDWSGPDTAGLRGTVEAHATPGRPVIAVNLAAGGEDPTTVLHNVDERLRAYRRFGVSPVLLTTFGSAQTADLFQRIRETHRPVVIRPVPAVVNTTWQVERPDGTVELGGRAEPDRVLFDRAISLHAVPAGPPVAGILARWLFASDWPAAEAFQRTHHARLRDPEIARALAVEVEADPGLAVFGVALELAARHESLPEERLRPAATIALDVEPVYDGGPVPPSFVFDYLATRGERPHRFAMDGVLFRLLLDGAISRDQAMTLVRATADTAVDRANLTVFEVVTALRELPVGQLGGDPLRHPLIRRLATVSGSGATGCVHPTDRTAWVWRMDALMNVLRADGTGTGAARADLLNVALTTLSNC
ncbi:hypothetical protein [Catenuloplanes japonicus]|uniref:hypothetical protein n=1 Tax=Catenuloplanes japonicus TaxID=33876 RepID=UPI0005276345|nr:hypothetical protein [Catenuloplanes japonicus]